MPQHRILALCGSLRAGSLNRRLLDLAVRAASRAGAEVDPVESQALNLPLYDGDVEQAGVPEGVAALKSRVASSAGLLIASPEYNHSIPGGLKNALDWLSRPPG